MSKSFYHERYCLAKAQEEINNVVERFFLRIKNRRYIVATRYDKLALCHYASSLVFTNTL